MVTQYAWQKDPEVLRGWSDSDFAGCQRTAKSTSGESSTQKTTALSCGEAELMALVKCSCEVLGAVQLAHDWDLGLLGGQVHVDLSAALGVVGRRG